LRKQADVAQDQITGPRLPMINPITNMTRKTKNNTFAIQAAVPANPPKPKAAAIKAKTKNNKAQLNMMLSKQKR